MGEQHGWPCVSLNKTLLFTEASAKYAVSPAPSPVLERVFILARLSSETNSIGLTPVEHRVFDTYASMSEARHI